MWKSGFCETVSMNPGTAVFNNCAEIRNILPENKGNTMFTAMALHNKYDLDQLEDYDGKTIDALRITCLLYTSPSPRDS